MSGALLNGVQGPESRHRATGTIVIGGDYRALGVVRSLGRHNIPVWVLTDEHRLSASSRFSKTNQPFPDADDNAREAYLLELAQAHGLHGWVLIPSGDETAAFIARRHQSLSQIFTLTTPPWDVFRWAYDKQLTNQIADRLGIDHPRTWHPDGSHSLASLDVVFPAILKPAYKVTLNHFTIAKAWQVESREELTARYDEVVRLAGPDAVMVQELIPGGGESQLSYAALARDGRVVAAVTARRTRQFPMDFGRASTFVETIDDGEVALEARRLVREMRFDGLVEIEFKRDQRDRRLKLLDVNPRVWGWHTLGRRAGVDFPYLLWRLAVGMPVDEVRPKPGVRWIRGLTDFPTVLKEVRAGRLGIAEYLRTLRPPAEWAVLAFDDPWPALYEVVDTLRVALRRGTHRSEKGDAAIEQTQPIAAARDVLDAELITD